MKWRLTPTDFRATVDQLARFGDRPTALARAVLVDGMSPALVGRQYGVTREAARRAASRVYHAWRERQGGELAAAIKSAEAMIEQAMRAQGLPDDWVPSVTTLPAQFAAVVRDVERHQLRKLQGEPPP